MLRPVLRIVGTVFGTAIGWFPPTFTADPVISILVLLVSAGAGAATTFWIGTVYSYGVLRATITVLALDHSVDTTQLAADRVWCTLIGVVVVTAITFAFTPRRPELRPERIAPPPWVTLRHGAIAADASLRGVGLLKLIGGPAPGSRWRWRCCWPSLLSPLARRCDWAGRKHVFPARRRGCGAWVQRASPRRHRAGAERGLVHGAVPPHRCDAVSGPRQR